MPNIWLFNYFIFISFIFLIFGIIQLVRGFKNIVSFVYFNIVLFILLWLIAIHGFYWNIFNLDRNIYIKITHISGIFISGLITIFSLKFPKNIIKRKFIDLIIFILIFCSFLWFSYLILRTEWIIGRVIDFKYEISSGYIIYSFFLIFYFVISYIFLFYQFYTSVNKIEKYQIFFFFIGIILSSIPPLIFDLIFPYLGIFKYIWVGPIFTFLGIVFWSIAIFKFGFLNIKTIISELLVYSLWLVMLTKFLLSYKKVDFYINGFILLLMIIFGVFLIRSVYKEVKQKEELEKLNKKLEDLNRIKSEFLSFASHQVKAPMAIVKGYATLIADGSIENVPDQVKEFANKIKESVNNLLVLVEEFMDYRRIEENKMDFEFQEVEGVSFIKEIFENLRPLAEKKGLDYSFINEINSVMINLDKLKFSQVIQNLIDNAIKYTKEGWIKLNIKKDNDDLIICVSDSGIGMSKELQKKLFGEFIRDPSIKKEIHGSGLGLYIAKYIVEFHQGKIWAESEGENKGSNFYIKLPLLKKEKID